MSTKRLAKERANLEKNPLDYATISVVGDDIHHWRIDLLGPASTPYANGTFTLDFEFPAQYPFKPPQIKFLTKIYHPNVSKNGEICADLIRDGWGPTLNVRHCIEVLRGAMLSPDPDHPLEADIATQMREKPKEFERAAVKFTKEHAM